MSDAPSIPPAPAGKHPFSSGLTGIVGTTIAREGEGFSIEKSVRAFAEKHNIDEPVARFLLCRMSGLPANEAEVESGISLVEFAGAVANHPEIREMVAVAMHQMGVDALYKANSLNNEIIGDAEPPEGTLAAIKNYISIARLGAPGYFGGKTATKGRRGQEESNRAAGQKQMAKQDGGQTPSLLEKYKRETQEPQ